MPRDNTNGTYQLPSNSQASPNTTIESARYNATILDIEQDLNSPRPISSGGTGETTLEAVKTAFGITALELAIGSTGNIDAANITSGTLAPARLSGTYNIAISGNAATASSAATATLLNGETAAFYLDARNLTETVSNDRLPDTISSNITGNAATATNSTQLGGFAASNYARTDASVEIFTGRLDIDRISNNEQVRIGENSTSGAPFVSLWRAGVRKGYLQIAEEAIILGVEQGDADFVLRLNTAGTLTWRGNQIWTSGNMGAGSELDADRLDGQQGSFYLDARNLTETVPDARLPGTISSNITGTATNATQLGGVAASNYARRPYTGSSASNVTFEIGEGLMVNNASVSRNSSLTVRLSTSNNTDFVFGGTGAILAGEWRGRGRPSSGNIYAVRVS